MPEATIGDVTLAYEDIGDGDPVLLVCGTGQQAFTWQLFQVPALTEAGYRVVTFDNRGMPPSECPPAPYSVKQMTEDTAGLIEQLDLAPCRVAGLSLGAFITQELALAHPGLVRCAVMMATIGRADTFGKQVVRAWLEMDESPPSRLVEAVTDAFLLWGPDTLRDDERMQQYLDFVQQAPRWENPGRLGQHTADRDYDDRLGALAGIRVPSLVIGFQNDMLTGAVRAREVADVIPGCEYVEIPGAGHAGPMEKPEEVNQALLDFFARH
jgi:pimeloyl-ACP methyl ester carboxylesterase